MLRFFLICNNIFLIFYQIFFTWGIGIYVWNYNIKGVAMTSLDLDGCVYKKQIKMRNKQLFTTSCICYILLYLSSILYFFIFSALFFFFFLIFNSWPKYLAQEKWWSGHTSCLRAKLLICFRMCWQSFPKKSELWIEVFPRSREEGFRKLGNFLWSIRHGWSTQITSFWGFKYQPTYLPA